MQGQSIEDKIATLQPQLDKAEREFDKSFKRLSRAQSRRDKLRIEIRNLKRALDKESQCNR